MKRILLTLLCLLICTALTAAAEFSLPQGVTDIGANAFEGDIALKGQIVLPDGIKRVGSGAFAGTRVHALIMPAGCETVSGSVLAGTEAAYIYLNGSGTAISGEVSDVAYVFGPAFGSASHLENFYAADTLVTDSGFYYSVTEGSAVPLCAVDGTAVSGEVVVPKLVGGQPVRALDTLIVHGCDNLEGLRVPAYLTMPDHLSVSTYQTMTATAPIPSKANAAMGDTVTWTTSATGAYGEITYLWTFNTDGVIETVYTAEPTVEHVMTTAGSCIVSVVVTDELNDSASAASEAFPVEAVDTIYRALLVCNTYPGTDQALPGSDNDVAGMRSMLSRMKTTPYRVSTRSNLTADGIVSAIQNTFAGATVNDVSLFYFSGHGTNAAGTSYHGALIGTSSTYLTVARLKAVLDEIPGKKVVIVDTCHSGQLIGKGGEPSPVSTADLNAFNSKVVAAFSVMPKGENDLANSGYYVITAAHSTEDAISMGHDQNGDGVLDKYFGLFTYGVCHGSGWNLATNTATSLNADADNNGEITLYEAYAYARYMAKQSHPGQTAQIYPANSGLVVWAK